MIRSVLISVNWGFIICHTRSKLIHLWKSCTCEKPPTRRQYNISSSESNLNLLLPSLAKNTAWIPDSCVELIFQLKFTLLLILHFISVHGSGVMLFHVEGEFISSVPSFSYQQICAWRESYEAVFGTGPASRPLFLFRNVPCVCHSYSLFCSWGMGLSWISVWRIKNNRTFEYFGIVDPIGCPPLPLQP